MDLDAQREKVAEELWAGADLPAPLNKDGIRTEWVKLYRQKGKVQPNVWVRCFRGRTRNEFFRIKWKAKTAEFLSAGLM